MCENIASNNKENEIKKRKFRKYSNNLFRKHKKKIVFTRNER